MQNGNVFDIVDYPHQHDANAKWGKVSWGIKRTDWVIEVFVDF